MIKIDEFILDRCYQPITDFLYNLTNKDCFWWSSATQYGCALAISIDMISHYEMNVGVKAFFIMAMIVCSRIHDWQATQMRGLMRRGLANPLRIMRSGIRISQIIAAIFFAPLSMVGMRWLLLAFWALVISADYAIACTPVPRNPIRLRVARRALA